MKKRILKLNTTINGFRTTIGEIKISNFIEERKTTLTRVCPKCQKIPKWTGGYTCECGEKYSHWSKLKPMLNGKAVVKPKLTDTGDADLYIISKEDFTTADATVGEHGIEINDQNTAKNIQKLLIATAMFGKVILLKWNETEEQKIGLLTVTDSRRIIIKEIVPLNLLIEKETIKIDLNAITDEELKEAENFISLVKPPTDIKTLLEVNDYRSIGLEETPVENENVKTLEEIIAQATVTT